MQTWKIVALVVLCLAVAGVIAGVSVNLSAVKRSEKKRIDSACALSNSGDTIFVSMVSYCNTRGAAETLASLFANAHCPLRVYVGLFEVYAPEEEQGSPVLDEYATMVRFSKAPFCLKDHVRILRVPEAENQGILTSMEQVERHLYRGERFACTLQPHTGMAPSWDAHCISVMADAPAKTVLTAVLPRAAAVGSPSLTSPGTYCALTTTGSMTAFSLRKIMDKVTRVPALAWSSRFSFCLASDRVPYERTNDSGARGMDAIVHDLYMTVKLLAAGFHLQHPAVLVGVITDNHTGRTSSVPWKQATMRTIASMATPGVRSTLGIDTFNKCALVLTARSKLGLCKGAGTQEVELKLGSQGEYLSLLSRLETHGDRVRAV